MNQDYNLSPHFLYSECVRSEKADELGIDNTPPDDVLANIRAAAAAAEPMRSYLAHPVDVHSWYRCDAVNSAVGGSATSGHLLGWCIDFTCAGFGSPEDIVKFLISTGIKFDQLIQEGSWVHISFDPRMRMQVMTAHFVEGQHTLYTAGA